MASSDDLLSPLCLNQRKTHMIVVIHNPVGNRSFLSSLPFVTGNVVSLETFGDPHLAAVLLKKYLRDLPEPIFPESMYSVIRRCPIPTNDPTDMSSVTYIRENLLSELAPCVYILLSHVLRMYSITFARFSITHSSGPQPCVQI